MRLARDRAREQRLACSWRADHEHAARHHGPGLGVALGVAQEVDDLADLRLRTLVPGDVVERGGGPFLVEHLRAGPADSEDALHLAGCAARQPHPEPDQEDERGDDNDPAQQLAAEAGRRGGASDLYVAGLQLVEQCLAGLRRDDHGVVGPVGQRPGARPARLCDRDRLHRVLADVGEELRVRQRGLPRAMQRRQPQPKEERHDKANRQQPVPPAGRLRRGRRPRTRLVARWRWRCLLAHPDLAFPPGGPLSRGRCPALSNAVMPAQQAYVLLNAPDLSRLPALADPMQADSEP